MMKKRDHWIKKVLITILVGLLAVSVNAAGDSKLAKPKADGLIGEQANGYIGLVSNDVPADIRKLVDQVNAKRKSGYEQIARKQGIPVSEVEKVGGNTAYEKTRRGNYVRDANGRWRKK